MRLAWWCFTTSAAVHGSKPAAHAHDDALGHDHEEAHDRLIVFGDRERDRERARARARLRRSFSG
jgi:hypothetical protein